MTLLFWTVGGDNCPPCVASAKANEIPAAKELGPNGLVVMESFNGIPCGFLIDLETMKILKIDPTLAFVRAQMTTIPARP